ncbi:MAG TPA: sensor histidine kinase [Ohtaekwangia sp.]|nr:sensor histidine kinase [Ohtaekwangia sp.]
MYRFLAGVLFVFCVSAVQGQSFSKEAVDKKLSMLDDRGKVTFVHENFYSIYSEDFANALRLTAMASDLAHRNKWKDLEGYTLAKQGVVLFLRGDYENALPKFISASKIFDSLQHFNGLAFVNNEMGVFYSKQGDLKTSHHHLDQALKYSQLAGNEELRGTALSHKAVMLEREGKFDEAYALNKIVYQIRVAQKDSVGLGYILLDLAAAEQRKGNRTKTLEYIGQSTAVRRKINDRQGLAVNLVNTGEAYVAFGEFANAARAFEQGLAQAIAIGYTDLIRYTYDQLAFVYTQTNDYKTAFAYQQKSQHFKDSLFNLDRTKVIADLTAKYDTEKKQQLIVLQEASLAEQEAQLQRNYAIMASLVLVLVLLTIIFFLVRNRMKRKQELLTKEHDISIREAYIRASIQSQETERKRFAQDLHDGMGQLISALRLSVSGIRNDLSTEERVSIFSKAEKIMHEMYHEIRGIAFNLMPQTLIQQGLVPALDEMARRLSDSGKVMINVSGFEVPERLEEIQEISLYRIIQEWVNNVTKYAAATSIEVQLVGYEDEISIVVEDNGRGFDPAVLERGSGHGWRNIQSRLNLIRGTVDIDSRPDRAGTTMSIRMPFKKQTPVPEPVVLNTQQHG